jgi:hypothetical protein
MDNLGFQAKLDAYKSWLVEQLELDMLDREAGLSPLPRSPEERLALYYHLPVGVRRRFQHQKTVGPGHRRSGIAS